MWSYVYRGNKCYSCNDNVTRESNAKSITVQPNSFVEVQLQNIVEEAEPGSYKLKIKALQKGLKTPKEFTYDIQIKQGEKDSSESSDQTEQSEQSTGQSDSSLGQSITGSVIESKSFLINRALPYILATLCALLVIYIIIKKI